MRLALIRLVAVAAALAAGVQSGGAQESFLTSGFAREAHPANRPGRWIVLSEPGSNASRERADWAASAWRIRFGARLAKSRRRKAGADGGMTIRSPIIFKNHMSI